MNKLQSKFHYVMNWLVSLFSKEKIRSVYKRSEIAPCRICMRDVDFHQSLTEYLFGKDIICHDCCSHFVLLDRIVLYQGMRLWMLYEYQDALENLIYQYKEQRDIALAEVFLYRFAHKINRRYVGYSLVFMPSSLQKIQERGFSHLKEMTKMLTLPYYDGVKKTSTQKQSLQNKKGRKTIGKYLELDDAIPIPDTPLLLFDDVCTSGATLSAVKTLFASHPHPVDACVLSVHPLFVEYCDENSLSESEGCFILKKQKEVGKCKKL